MDIVIYMNPKDFIHKTMHAITAYWSMGRVPRNFNGDKDRIYLATCGEVHGSMQCEEFNPEDLNGETIVWDSRTWKELIYNPIECKPFRGFRYRWWDKEENDEK